MEQKQTKKTKKKKQKKKKNEKQQQKKTTKKIPAKHWEKFSNVPTELTSEIQNGRGISFSKNIINTPFYFPTCKIR